MLGIFGGTGLYQLDQVTILDRIRVETPFGNPSGSVMIGRIGSTQLAFLARHGEQHSILPHEINYRANIWALKSIGVRQVLSVSAVGSLSLMIEPGHFVFPDQYLDFTKGKREQTFFGDGLVGHISTAKPVCSNLSKSLFEIGLKMTADFPDLKFHNKANYACVEGPRLGTQAESNFLKSSGAGLVGMTNIPEVFLAREAQLCYSTIAVVTDYDSWHEDPDQHASVEMVIARYKQSLKHVQHFISKLISEVPVTADCECRHALKSAILTPEINWTERHRALLKVLRE